MNTRRCVICGEPVPYYEHASRTVCSDLCHREKRRRNRARMVAERRAAGMNPHRSVTRRRLREPIPVAPFLEWCERRAKILHAEYNDGGGLGTGDQQLRDEIGWYGDSGAKRLYRWRHETPSGLVERADVEDALWRAGVGFWELYDDVAAMDEAAA